MTTARFLTESLRGRWHGRYGTAFCPAHRNSRTPALSLADGAAGRLLIKCHAGCTFEDVLAALRGRGLLKNGVAVSAPFPPRARSPRAEETMTTARRAEQARRIWDESRSITGSVAERYLRGRAISCDLPSTLRFHPSCWHSSGVRLPAMVALIEGSNGFAVHRTYLRPDGFGKAAVEPAKAMLGSVGGGAVRLYQAPGALVVAEGIETTLSLQSGLLGTAGTLWATLSTSGMTMLRLPASPAELLVAADGDEAGRRAAFHLATRAAALGWQVSMLDPPEGADWNDVLVEAS